MNETRTRNAIAAAAEHLAAARRELKGAQVELVLADNDDWDWWLERACREVRDVLNGLDDTPSAPSMVAGTDPA